MTDEYSELNFLLVENIKKKNPCKSLFLHFHFHHVSELIENCQKLVVLI